VVLAPVYEWKRLGECPAEHGETPLFVVRDHGVVDLLRGHEVDQDPDDEVDRQPVQVDLGWMREPVTLPVVVETDRHALVAALDRIGQDPLHALVLRERDMWSVVEDPATRLRIGRGMAADVCVPVEAGVHLPLGLQAVTGTERRETAAQDDNR
jgi:hypothetical protein